MVPSGRRVMGMVTQGLVFVDRQDAGFEVGKLLEPAYKDTDALVLGIPPGGVIVGYEIAKVLNAELSTLVAQEIPHPFSREAIGSLAEDGSVFLSSHSRDIDVPVIWHMIKVQSEEIRKCVNRFRSKRLLPNMKGRTVIIADDGIASGAIIVPAIRLCMCRNAARIVVAAPVAGRNYIPGIDSFADEVVIAERPDDFYSIGQVYKDFHSPSDEEVLEFLNDSSISRSA